MTRASCAPADPTPAPPAFAPCCAVLEAIGHAAWVVDAASLRIVGANAAAHALLGAEALDGTAADAPLATPEDLAYWSDVRSGRSDALCSETVIVDRAGRPRPVTRRIRRFALADGALPGFVVTVEDRSQAAREAHARDALLAELQATLESTADGILVTDPAGRIRGFNQRFAQIWQIPAALLVEHRDAAIHDWMRRRSADAAGYQRRVDAIQADALAHADERLELKSGQVVQRVTQPQRIDGQPCGRVWSFRDLTELVAAGRRIETLSTTDALTGLVNRAQLALTLGESILQARRDDGRLALLILDLDRFKQINDSLGARAGDQVLRTCAERLRAVVQQGDVVARTGDDRFALLLQRADRRGAEAAARRVLSAISHPCSMDGLQFTLTCSVGLALYPSDGDDAEQLLRNAERAMQCAKLGGRGCFRFHQPDDDADLRQRMRLDHAMRQALACQRFRLKYQPQLDLGSGAVVGAEALVRWRDPELGEVPPAEFIPVAEDSGFIIAIGGWVLAQAVRQAAAWRNAGTPVPVAINVSALQFQQPDFTEQVAHVLREHQLPGGLLELELTESVLLRDADDALQRLTDLAKLGVQLSIDDFGTGYSSLSYLKRFPIRRLKIDRSFVQGVPDDPSDAGIVRAIVQMADALGLSVIAEGVETEAQRAFLHEIGCADAQGHLYAPALDAISFEERLRALRTAPRRRLMLVVQR